MLRPALSPSSAHRPGETGVFSGAYLLALCIGLGGLALIDRRYQLVIWRNRRRAVQVWGVGMAVFLIWDAAGIALGIFSAGSSPYATGIMLAPELPLEEPVFLTLLIYQTLLLWQAIGGRHHA